MSDIKYYPLSVGEIWEDTENCHWYIYECMTFFSCPNRYYAKCVEGFNLGKIRTYHVSGESTDGHYMTATLIKKVY